MMNQSEDKEVSEQVELNFYYHFDVIATETNPKRHQYQYGNTELLGGSSVGGEGIITDYI